MYDQSQPPSHGIPRNFPGLEEVLIFASEGSVAFLFLFHPEKVFSRKKHGEYGKFRMGSFP